MPDSVRPKIKNKDIAEKGEAPSRTSAHDAHDHYQDEISQRATRRMVKAAKGIILRKVRLCAESNLCRREGISNHCSAHAAGLDVTMAISRDEFIWI
jgi:hypothetical protein